MNNNMATVVTTILVIVSSFSWISFIVCDSSFDISTKLDSRHYQVLPTVADMNLNCESGCLTSTADSAFVIVPPSQIPQIEPECYRWNATILLQHQLRSPSAGEISVYFDGCCGTNNCFDMFEMFLIKLLDSDCNEGSVEGYIQFSKEKDKSSTQVFNNVAAPGVYCVRFRPIHDACENIQRRCKVLNSEIVNLNYFVQPSVMQYAYGSLQHHNMVISVISVLCIVFVLSVISFVYWRFRKRQQFVVLGYPVQYNDDSEHALNIENEDTANIVRVLMLHTFDYVNKSLARALNEVLQKVIGDNCVYFELIENQVHEVDIDPFSWLESRLNLGRVNDVMQKVIVVESERAVEHQVFNIQLLASAGKNSEETGYPPENSSDVIACSDIPLDEMFVSGLKALTKKDDDYNNVLVVHFTDMTPKKCELTGLTPRQTYYLPEHMLKLVVHLLPHADINSVNQDELMSKLKSAMRENDYFCDLIDRVSWVT